MEAIVNDARGSYTPQQVLAYVSDIEMRCLALDLFPHKFPEVELSGRKYRRFRFKAHTIFYRVFEKERHILIDAVLHSRQDFERHL